MYGIIGKNGDSLLRCQVILDKVVKNSASKNTLVKQYLTAASRRPLHTLKRQEKYCGVPLRNAFLITIKTGDFLLSAVPDKPVKTFNKK